MKNRIITWFSCGAASAVAAKMAVKKYGDRCLVVYCDTSNDEHSDNLRFFEDVQKWLGKKIIKLKSEEYLNRWDVYKKTNWLVGNGGARCTIELKKKLRFEFQKPDDVHVIGFTFEEKNRIEKFKKNNPELFTEFLLFDNQVTKQMCYALLKRAGIELPAMYKLGYKNNNCIGCVKGRAGYWNKIRKDFPKTFDRMAKEERRISAIKGSNVTVVTAKNKSTDFKWKRIFLDELDPNLGHYKSEPDISCDIFCNAIFEEMG